MFFCLLSNMSLKKSWIFEKVIAGFSEKSLKRKAFILKIAIRLKPINSSGEHVANEVKLLN